MADYCTILLNPNTKSDILAACIQAAASLQAGEAQAAAARQAGWLSFAAGSFALAAGALAYYASFVQTKQFERQRLARESAYAAQICAISIRARDELISLFLCFKVIDDGGPAKDLSGIFVTDIAALRDELKPANWENHALVGSEYLNQFAVTYETLQSCIVEIDRFNSISQSRSVVRQGIWASEVAKMQCEALMTAISHKAPAAMQAELKPVKLLSGSL